MTASLLSGGKAPVILDFDASVPPVAVDEVRIDLAGWQEAIRFGCSMRVFAGLEDHLDRLMPQEYDCVFTGSGDYHHLSLLLLRRLARLRGLPPDSLDLVVCDNHPDNMRYLFGLHCGSWVRHASSLACVRRVHVIGITSPDIGLFRAWENYLMPFVRKKLWYWSVGQSANWLGLLGRGAHSRRFRTADALIAAFTPVLGETGAVYLSIDKDVLSPSAAYTGWDQGVCGPAHLEAVLRGCAGRLIGCDVTGDFSVYAYAGRFKRLLSRRDGLTGTLPDAPESLRAERQAMNIRLLEMIREATKM